MSYRVTVANDDDEVLGIVVIDGLDLRRTLHQLEVGERVRIEMGTRAVVDCALRPEPVQR